MTEAKLRSTRYGESWSVLIGDEIRIDISAEHYANGQYQRVIRAFRLKPQLLFDTAVRT